MRNYYKKIIHDNGDISYHDKKGHFHRVDDPAIENKNGSKFWYLSGELHRTDGPAVAWENGDKIWYINGKRHREDGPAIECKRGDKEWYLNNNNYAKEEFLYLTKYKEKYQYSL